MHITNKNNLPEPIYRAVLHNSYTGNPDKFFASVTGLLKGVKQFVLEKRYQEELEEDASDRIWSLMGSAMHTVLERSVDKEDEDILAEKRFSAVVDGEILSGGIDLYENETIYDFKFTSVFSYTNSTRLAEWTKQLNMYAYLYQKFGYEVTSIKVLAIYRDWQKSRYLCKRPDELYPRQVEEIDVPLWDLAETEAYIKQRFALIKEALELPDDMIEPCTFEERWEEEPRYAIMKPGNQRATKVFTDKEEAESYLNNMKDKDSFMLEHRQGLPRKCQEYCPVSAYCSYAKSRGLLQAG